MRIDPAQIDQILANLVINARDAIEGVGKVTVETANVVVEEPLVCAGGGEECEPGEYVLLAVSDTGCGMDAETQEKIFEPFFTTKEVGVGTGLGLATVHGIVRQNKGAIRVYSEPGQGTMFKIYLPRHVREEAAEGVKVAEAEAVPRGTETVLLVEDEEKVLELGKALLEGLGYRVLAARSGAEAIRLVVGYDGQIHLVMTDVVMPEMNGREVVERVAALRPGVKALYMSGYTANAVVHRGVLEEGVAFLSKPFTLDELARKVREALKE